MPASARPLFAIGLRLIGAAMFATMMLLIKLAGDAGISLPEIMFWRQAMTLPILGIALAATGQLASLRSDRIGAHGRRALVGMTCMVFNFWATIVLPLPVSTTLGFVAPLFAVMLAATMMREAVGPWRWSAVVLGFAGVLAITRPGQEQIDPAGAAAGLVAALLVAVINFQIRDLGRTEPPHRSVFWFALFGSIIMLPVLPFFAKVHDIEGWLLLAGLGLFGTLGQLCLTASLRHGAVASVIAMDYTMLVWTTLYGWLVWDHLPGAAIWAGAPLIVAAGLIVVWREHRLYARPAPTGPAASE